MRYFKRDSYLFDCEVAGCNSSSIARIFFDPIRIQCVEANLFVPSGAANRTGVFESNEDAVRSASQFESFPKLKRQETRSGESSKSGPQDGSTVVTNFLANRNGQHSRTRIPIMIVARI